MKKVGIITFHNSYNCGSMLETYAIHKYIEKCDIDSEIVNFSSDGQKEMYSTFSKNSNLKNIVKNLIILPHKKRIDLNNRKYEEFKNKYFKLSEEYSENSIINDNYVVTIAGSDQIWNITIPDSNDAYFLNWVTQSRKVAYAPSFGARNILKYSSNPEKYAKYLKNFDALSIREANGKKWINDLIGVDVPILIDPTLLLDRTDYEKIIDDRNTPKEDYIFFYCPSFNPEICKFVKQISKKYKLPVIAWSTKSYYKKFIFRFGFELPKYESPSVYLSLIKNAKLIFTTSFHGTIFSTVFKKKFYTIKNGGMYGDDDRVLTLLTQLDLFDRLIPYEYDEKFDYLKDVDYSKYDKKVNELRKNAMNYIKENIEDYYNEASK